MSFRNEYQGYVKLPNKALYNESIRLDFNAHIDSQPESTKLEGFTLRMLVLGKNTNDQQPEMSITMTTEQWLDLMESMKSEFDSAQEVRKKFDDLSKE